MFVFFIFTTAMLLFAGVIAYRHRYQFPRVYENVRNFGVATAVATMVVLSSLPSHATLDLNIDVQPLFDSIETYLPVFFVILAIGGGIKIAMAIGKMIIGMVADAFA